MSKSGLTTATALADSSNYTHGRKGYKICKITPHHMAGVLTGKQCARIFQNPNRNASANFCIGNDGDIVWNFTKFLVDKEGNVIRRISPIESPMLLEEDILNLL